MDMLQILQAVYQPSQAMLQDLLTVAEAGEARTADRDIQTGVDKPGELREHQDSFALVKWALQKPAQD
ncbi:hypothetical protein KEM55_006178 [Ascosphaera atra]|nr:hypothetical protein KEM55_006178 [Ascosphaera atra]